MLGTMDPINAWEFRDAAEATPLVIQPDVHFLLDQFGGLTDLAVLAAECRTGGHIDENGVYRRKEIGRATVILATQWLPDDILVLHLEDIVRIDVMSAGVYGGVSIHVDEGGFRIDFPDGAQMAAKRAFYQIIPATGATRVT